VPPAPLGADGKRGRNKGGIKFNVGHAKNVGAKASHNNDASSSRHSLITLQIGANGA
jgi:hypothetical protein